MHAPIRYFLTPILLLIFSASGYCQQVHTYIDRDSIRAGEVLQYTIVLDRDSEFRQILFPDRPEIETDTLQFHTRERHQVTAYRDSLVYRLQFFGTEDYQIPRYPIHLISQDSDTTTLYTNSVPLSFSSVLAGEEEFRPMKPIFEFAALLWPWLLALVILALIAWYLYNRYRKREPAPPQPVRKAPLPFSNPFDRLETSLQALHGNKSPLAMKQFKEFYVDLGDAIRQYFEDVYEIDALEMTSREILTALQHYPADKQVIEITRKVLSEADMVKFAKFEPTTEQARKSLEIALEFLETVRSVDSARVDLLKERHEEREQINRQNEVNVEGRQ
ncbi:MAG: hypothetical protein WD355_11360 [Balneolaceae bacterium]